MKSLALAWVAVLVALGCGGSAFDGGSAGAVSGGSSGIGGASGGASGASGGTVAGGAAGIGGVTVMGGAAGAGGVTLMGGASGVGGAAGKGGASGTGGSSGTGGMAGKGGAAGAGGAAGSGGIGGSTDPDRCKLPAEVGPCDASVPSYWFNAKTGLCQWFVYGGCGGNANRFATMEACYAACAASAVQDFAKCSAATDCVQASVSCCGPCDTDRPDTIVAINGSVSPAYRTSLGCDNVRCEACPPPDPVTHAVPYLRVDCRAGRCVWIDTRQTEMTACSNAGDCVLRNGLGCCERCGTSLETLVAVNGKVPQCASAAPCPPCVSTYPADYAATCRGGQCAVVKAQIAGSACTAAAGCGPGFTCLSGPPGGYCVANSLSGTPCSVSASTCPVGTTCAPVPWSQMPSVCMRTCAATSECRAGQQCNYLELFPGSASSPRSAERVCWPTCTVGMDQTCNDNPIISSIHGNCQPDGSCKCIGTWAQNPVTGRCL
jgi:hypothetical protein